jgi:ribose/xylose/arabinose/galactoside ABC-type transport system permease subunit
LSAYWEKAIQGVIILATVLFEAEMQLRRASRPESVTSQAAA